nr:hypothetical protein [Nostoc sp. C057]
MPNLSQTKLTHHRNYTDNSDDKFAANQFQAGSSIGVSKTTCCLFSGLMRLNPSFFANCLSSMTRKS